MESQIKIGGQNTQQIGQNSVNQTTPTPVSEKLKINYWMIFAIILFTILVGGIFFVFLFSSFFKKVAPLTNKSTSSENKVQNVVLQTLSLSLDDLKDSETELYFSDANKLYKVRLDGSQAQELATLPHNITTISMLANGTLLINTDNSKYEKVVNKQGVPGYKQLTVEYGYWVLPLNSKKPEEIDEQKYHALKKFKDNTNGERVYTKELSDGQAEILVETLDRPTPTKVGLLKEKLLNIQVCEVGERCLERQHPEEFIPSFNGKFLLNKPPQGGGLGIPGIIVVSRDGSRAYKIDLYWNESLAIWIGDNKLFTKDENGQKIYTFNEDGTFDESTLRLDLKGYFDQNGLSPTKRYLVVNDYNPVGISLFDFDNEKIMTVDKEDRERLIQQYNLQDEIKMDPRINHIFGFLGWNKKGDKFLYSEQISSFASIETAEKLDVREIKIFDLTSGKTYTVARLNPHPTDADNYLLQGKPVANVGQFAIR